MGRISNHVCQMCSLVTVQYMLPLAAHPIYHRACTSSGGGLGAAASFSFSSQQQVSCEPGSPPLLSSPLLSSIGPFSSRAPPLLPPPSPPTYRLSLEFLLRKHPIGECDRRARVPSPLLLSLPISGPAAAPASGARRQRRQSRNNSARV